mgnify:CR=1 FL=1
MKSYRLITTNPVALYNRSIGGLPSQLSSVSPPPAPNGYAYVEELPFPEEAPAEGFVWSRELTTEAYGWKQVEAPPAPNPEWYVQPAWRIRAIAKVTPYGGGTLMDGINTIVESLSSDPVQKAVAEEVFYGGNTLERDSALLVGMAVGLGLDDVELDNIFQQAASIEV